MSERLGYAEKMNRATTEAKMTVWALVLIVAVWILLGFGLTRFNLVVCHTPVWIIGGTVGTWLFSVAVSVFLTKHVYSDFSLDAERGEDGESA